MQFLAEVPPRIERRMKAEGVQYRKDLYSSAVIATDRASKDGQKAVQDRIRSVGLGRLSGAVGHTSAKRKRDYTGDPYGVIFARGGDESRGGQALESYSRGATILPRNGTWLAFPTKAVPKFVSVAGRRFRTTPELYMNSGLVSSIGKLVFKPISARRAVLVIKKASVNIRTGRAKTPNTRKSKTSTFEKDVVAFVLIKVTRRAQRFDQRRVMQAYGQRVPQYMQVALAEIRARR